MNLVSVLRKLTIPATVLSLLAAGCGSSSSGNSGNSVSVQVTAPADGYSTLNHRITVRGTVTEGAQVQVLGQAAQVTGSTFSSSVALNRGDNRIDVTATMDGAQPATTSITVTRKAPKNKSAKPKSTGGSNRGTNASVGTRDCGGGVLVNSVTSCPFGFRVRAAFTVEGGPTIQVYSPVTGQTYTMTCTSGPGAQETCRGGNNAVVTF